MTKSVFEKFSWYFMSLAASSCEELFVASGADVIVTGDSDLLALGPFERVAIVTPARFLTTRPE